MIGYRIWIVPGRERAIGIEGFHDIMDIINITPGLVFLSVSWDTIGDRIGANDRRVIELTP